MKGAVSRRFQNRNSNKLRKLLYTGFGKNTFKFSSKRGAAENETKELIFQSLKSFDHWFDKFKHHHNISLQIIRKTKVLYTWKRATW